MPLLFRLIRILSASDFRSLNSAHLRDPSGSRLNLADCTNLIAGITRNTNVVATLQSELDVADLEDVRAAFFGILACCLKNLIDKIIGNSENRLRIVSYDKILDGPNATSFLRTSDEGVKMRTYLFNFRSQSLTTLKTFSSAGNLSDKLIQLLLRQNAISIALKLKARRSL